jgi:hypothetical protein
MRQSPAIPRETGQHHGIFSPLLLLCSGVWITAMTLVVMRISDASRFAILIGCLAIATLLITYASWSLNPTWDDWGRIGIWFVFGLSLSIWMIGIFGGGWFLFPSLFMTVIALIMWPRKFDRAIATREGILAEIVGFLSGPVLVALTLSLFGF